MYTPQDAGHYEYTNSHPNVGYGGPSGTAGSDNSQGSSQAGMNVDYLQPAGQQAQQLLPHQFYQQQQTHANIVSSRPHSGSSFSPQTQARSSNGPVHYPLNQGGPSDFSHSLLPTAFPQNQSLSTTTTSFDMSMAANIAAQGPSSLAQQAQMQNAAQAARSLPAQVQQVGANGALSPQSASRERSRVTVLLDINTQLLQEVVSLQSQGKAGSTPNTGQQSPTSPTSTTDPTNAITNSPGEPPKSAGGTPLAAKPPSQDYAECMRRLQANLSYLAAIADAKKKANGTLPAGPAIMVPPPHLPQLTELYKKLNSLFPEAAQSNMNKAMAQAASQVPHANKPQQNATTSTLAQG